MKRPDLNEHSTYYGRYTGLVPEVDIIAALRDESTKTLEVLRVVPEPEAGTTHPPYTWTIRQVVGHLIDCERIFGARALRFARGDSSPLPGFDENSYALSGEFDRLRLSDLASEFEATRRSHLALFGNLPTAAWERRGLANGTEISVRALAYILVGHERHHMGIVRRRLGLVESAD